MPLLPQQLFPFLFGRSTLPTASGVVCGSGEDDLCHENKFGLSSATSSIRGRKPGNPKMRLENLVGWKWTGLSGLGDLLASSLGLGAPGQMVERQRSQDLGASLRRVKERKNRESADIYLSETAFDTKVKFKHSHA